MTTDSLLRALMSTVAIITGASQGIGRETAIRLAHSFSAAVLVARNDAGLQETAAAIRAQGSSKTLIIPCDLREHEAADRVVSQTLDAFGRIDAVVNVAGAVPQIDLFDLTEQQWEDGFALKLHAARRLTVRAWDALLQSKGSVVFISGNSAQAPKAPFAAVATVNAAIVALSKAFADRGSVDGVQVNCVLPGAVLTDRRRTYIEKWAHLHNVTVDKAMEIFPSKAGIERFGRPEEIAHLIQFLLSPEARWMTGSTLRMDGGEIKAV
jgi:3-oxoacyl-[acyl-carrier protein] reductase